jgi:hypothetical protein
VHRTQSRTDDPSSGSRTAPPAVAADVGGAACCPGAASGTALGRAPRLPQPTAISGCRPQDPQVASAADLDALTRRLGWHARRRGLAYGVGERLQVVCVSRLVGRVPDRKPDDIPAARCRHPVGVPGAQVVTVRLDEGGERAEHRRGVTVDIGQGIQGDLPAGRSGALARGQRSTIRAWCRRPGASGTRAPVNGGS